MKPYVKTAHQTANLLLQIKALKINLSKPFLWASGLLSPIYCDNRRILSFPEIRDYIKDGFAEIVLEKFGKPDAIAGVATGGIAHGVLVADKLDVPFIYVRAGKKEHGLGNQIEGIMHEGQNIIVIEDLVSTGKSSLGAVNTIREHGGIVQGMCAIFSYNFEVADTAFKSAACDLYTLSDYKTLLKVALEKNILNKEDFTVLERWYKQPDIWKK